MVTSFVADLHYKCAVEITLSALIMAMRKITHPYGRLERMRLTPGSELTPKPKEKGNRKISPVTTTIGPLNSGMSIQLEASLRRCCPGSLAFVFTGRYFFVASWATQ
jgi:hypothetical protein